MRYTVPICSPSPEQLTRFGGFKYVVTFASVCDMPVFGMTGEAEIAFRFSGHRLVARARVDDATDALAAVRIAS